MFVNGLCNYVTDLTFSAVSMVLRKHLRKSSNFSRHFLSHGFVWVWNFRSNVVPVTLYNLHVRFDVITFHYLFITRDSRLKCYSTINSARRWVITASTTSHINRINPHTHEIRFLVTPRCTMAPSFLTPEKIWIFHTHTIKLEASRSREFLNLARNLTFSDLFVVLLRVFMSF